MAKWKDNYFMKTNPKLSVKFNCPVTLVTNSELTMKASRNGTKASTYLEQQITTPTIVWDHEAFGLQMAECSKSVQVRMEESF